MRRLFVVLAKMLGLLQAYSALVAFMQVGIAISVLSRSIGNEMGETTVALMGTVMYCICSLAITWVLLVRTEWLADKLRIQEQGGLEGFAEDTILRTGMKLIGVYVLAYAIPAFVRTVLTYGVSSGGTIELSHFWMRILPAMLQLVLGVFLAMRSDAVLAFIARAERADGKRVFWGTLGIIVLLVVLALTVSSWMRNAHVSLWSAPRHSVTDSTTVFPKDTNAPAATRWYTSPDPQRETNAEKIVITTGWGD